MMQEPPFAVQIELVEGCTLSCSFCGINGIREKPGNFKFALHETIQRIASEIERAGWNPRIEFAMHGEPSMHPGAELCIGYVRSHLPQASIMMTSNGSGFLGPKIHRIKGFFESGLNVLALDWYEGVRFVPEILTQISGKDYVFYPDDPDANPHRRRRPHEHDLVIIRDISTQTKGTHATLNNHCGGGAPLNRKGQGQRCAKPFRELSFRWDGNVALCCNDFRGVFPIASIHDMNIEDLWNHERFTAARKFLYQGWRAFVPCMGCDALSERVGLLPDKYGRETLPQPTLEDERIVLQTMAQKSLTPVVLREWER